MRDRHAYHLPDGYSYDAGRINIHRDYCIVGQKIIYQLSASCVLPRILHCNPGKIVIIVNDEVRGCTGVYVV